VRIHFYPDGSAEETQIILLSQQDKEVDPTRIVVLVRPNTGKIVTKTLAEDEDVEDL